MRWPLPARAAALAVVAAVASPSPVLGQPPARERTGAAVMAVEHEWLAALRRRDVKALAHILGSEFIDSDFRGGAIPRGRYLAYFAHPIASRAPPTRQTFADTRVRFVAGGDVALVTGVLITRPAPASRPKASATADAVRRSRFTDVFVWRHARWQAIAGQETHFAAGAARRP